jgi:ABC-type polysaccharide/polyol phosphate export permease
MQLVNKWNPVTHVIEAMRALMITGYDWGAIGTALVSMAIVGVVLQAATLWSFHRLAR